MRYLLAVAVVLLVFEAATACVRAGEPVKGGEVIENSIGMNLVVIPAGEFDAGDDDEQPVHRVRITKPYYMGQTEVTQRQWERVMETTPWKGETFVKEGPTVAATCVGWDDAVAFCRKLTELEQGAGALPAGRVYRLPTDAEWEYACRAGTKTTWSFGDDEARLGDYAWFYGNSKTERYAHDVGRKKPNPWGLYDMQGNAWEWCRDWYGVYSSGLATDPTGPPGPPAAGSFRVIRGGGYGDGPFDCRCASRTVDDPMHRCGGVSFRVVRELE